jgi:hypothetical protein
MSAWIDVQHLEQSTWLGKPPPLRTVDTPVTPKTTYPRNFAAEFNSQGPKAIERAVLEKAIPSAEPHYVAPFLFYAEGIRQAAISQYFFLKPNEAQTLFYYYFSAANVDYMALPDALRLLLSRVAYPEDRQGLFAIFCAFADAYCESNQYIGEGPDEIRKLAIASVVLSMSKRKSDLLPQARFMQLIEHVRCPDEYKVFLYESLKEKPIVLFFTLMHFTSDPETIKRGTMLSSTGLFKKKKLFCVLQDGILKVYKDENCTKDGQTEEVPLFDVWVKFVGAKDKEPAKVVIVSKGGQAFGSAFTKGARKPAKKNAYEFSGPKDETELKGWVDVMNFMALYMNLVQMTNCSPKSD